MESSMGLFSKDIKTFEDLFVHQLQDIYYAEKQLVKALPKMAEKAADKHLKQGFLTHRDETKTHLQHSSRCSGCTGARLGGRLRGVDGIIEEANEVAGEVVDKNVLD